MHAVFKADGPETEDRYCVSEWWWDTGQPGPGPHSHEANEELFYVVVGTMSFLVGEEWIEAPRGSFLRVPAGTTHDFENRGDARRIATERASRPSIPGFELDERR